MRSPRRSSAAARAQTPPETAKAAVNAPLQPSARSSPPNTVAETWTPATMPSVRLMKARPPAAP